MKRSVSFLYIYIYFLKALGRTKSCGGISLNRISSVASDSGPCTFRSSNWVNDGDNQMITPMLSPLLVTTGSKTFHYPLLLTVSHAMNEVKHVAEAAVEDGADSLHVGIQNNH